MFRFWKSIVVKNSKVFCNLAVIVAGIAVNNCRLSFYQPKEPKGYAKFAEGTLNKSKKTD